jgi:hypothetical protein
VVQALRGGMELHQWRFPLAAFRELHGDEGGEVSQTADPQRKEAT